MSFTGKEKTLASLVIGGIGSGITAGSAFVAPASNAGHIATAALGVITFIATTFGVNMVPNSEVAKVVTTLGDEAQALGLIPTIPPVPDPLPDTTGAHAAPDVLAFVPTI